MATARVGGLAVGEPKADMHRVDWSMYARKFRQTNRRPDGRRPSNEDLVEASSPYAPRWYCLTA